MTMELMDHIGQKTVLFDSHVALNAKMVSFGGYKMPVSYSQGIQSEYFAVRKSVGIFDVSHMGEFTIKGDNALQFLQEVTINDVSKLNIGYAQYSAMCYEDGGIIDDLILYRTHDGYLMVVNASNIQKDYDWLCKHIDGDVNLEDISSNISLIALQGPKSRELLATFTDANLRMPFYTFEETTVCGYSVILSRTGYTGELGFEIYASKEAIIPIWDDLRNAGAQPAGLAARDILRMEMAYCLYGNDIDNKTNPVEAGLSWITALDKKEYIGLEKILQEKTGGPKRRLVAFKMLERGIPRQGYEVFIEEKNVGYVTSGTQSPSLNAGIGLAYIDSPSNQAGQHITIQIRNKYLAATIIKPPFIHNTSLLN